MAQFACLLVLFFFQCFYHIINQWKKNPNSQRWRRSNRRWAGRGLGLVLTKTQWGRETSQLSSSPSSGVLYIKKKLGRKGRKRKGWGERRFLPAPTWPAACAGLLKKKHTHTGACDCDPPSGRGRFPSLVSGDWTIGRRAPSPPSFPSNEAIPLASAREKHQSGQAPAGRVQYLALPLFFFFYYYPCYHLNFHSGNKILNRSPLFEDIYIFCREILVDQLGA